MTLVDGFAPPLTLQAMLVVRKTTETKNSLCNNQHCSVGGRGGTIILSYGWSHNFCEKLYTCSIRRVNIFCTSETRKYVRDGFLKTKACENTLKIA